MDILSIDFLPSEIDQVDISDRLVQLCSEAETIRASIAFWTLSATKLEQIVQPASLRAWSNPRSFLCVDIQPPTNIDNIATLSRKDISVFLNMRRLEKDAEGETESPGLLHTKMLLIDKKDHTAEIWIGSHNWTQFALLGPNTEASVIIHTEKGSSIYKQMESSLEDIRDTICRSFEIGKVKYYKTLQNKIWGSAPRRSKLIELEGYRVNNLEGQAIYIFGNETTDYTNVSSVNSNVNVAVYDSGIYDKTRETEGYLYKAKILQTGWLADQNRLAGGISFTEPRRYAFTLGGKFPRLERPQTVEDHVLAGARYFVNLEIEQIESRKFEVLDVPIEREALWVESESDPVVERLERRKGTSVLGKDEKMPALPEYRSLRVLVPAGDERAMKKRPVQKAIPEKDILLEKRQSRYSLISKKVIRRLD